MLNSAPLLTVGQEKVSRQNVLFPPAHDHTFRVDRVRGKGVMCLVNIFSVLAWGSVPGPLQIVSLSRDGWCQEPAATVAGVP